MQEKRDEDSNGGNGGRKRKRSRRHKKSAQADQGWWYSWSIGVTFIFHYLVERVHFILAGKGWHSIEAMVLQVRLIFARYYKWYTIKIVELIVLI